MKVSILLLTVLMGLSASASNQSYIYECSSYMVNGQRNTTEILILTASADVSTADILNETWDDNRIGGTKRANYKPRGNTSYLKFGQNLVVEESLISGGRSLSDGSLGGFTRIESEIEGGFIQYKFICKRSK